MIESLSHCGCARTPRSTYDGDPETHVTLPSLNTLWCDAIDQHVHVQGESHLVRSELRYSMPQEDLGIDVSLSAGSMIMTDVLLPMSSRTSPPESEVFLGIGSAPANLSL